MFKRFLGESITKFTKIIAILASFVTIASVAFFFGSSLNLLLRILILCIFFLFFLVISFGIMAYEHFIKNLNILPRIISGMKYNKEISDEKVLCLLEPSDLYYFGNLVSIYYIDNEEFEILIGYGEVISIQSNKIIQVLINNYNETYSNIINKLAENNATVIKKIIIKPNIPSSYKF